MDLCYQIFNFVEALIWLFVAAAIAVRVERSTTAQQAGVALGCGSFVLFAVTDLLEIPTGGRLPGWLWIIKILCGVLMITARFTWLGWSKFSWRSREVVFGFSCLVCVGLIVALQHWLT